MRIILLSILVLVSISTKAQLWVENFSGEANGATSGVAAGTLGGTWNVTTAPSSGTFSRQNFLVTGFHIENTTNEGVWETNTVDISSVGYAIISAGVAVGGFGFSDSDYLRFYYKLDGGPEVLFADISGSLLSITTEASAIVAGNSLQLIAKGVDNSFFGRIIFDDVTITAAPIIYSRKTGTWTDVTGGIGGTGTWSLTSHLGAACGCYPLNTQVAVIGNGHTVTLPASQTNIGTPPTTNLAPGAVDVKSSGTLRFNTNGVTLGIQAGLVRVRNGGTIDSSSGAITGEQISFLADVGGARLQVDPSGTVSIEDLVLSANATNLHYLEGSGSLTMTDDIVINADNAILENNMTSVVAVADRIDFASGTTGSEFINVGTLTATTLFFDDDNNTFTNSGTATFSGDITANGTGDDNSTITNNSSGTLNFVNLDGNASGASGDGGDMTILNSGTINQSGTFLDIPNNTNNTNDINNLNGAIWNYSGTGHDSNLRLFANNGVNSFNYSLAGAQQIITPVSGNGYSNLNLQNSGAKSALGNVNIYGDWSRTGTATFTPGVLTVTFSGLSTQTISAVGGETFASLTINNTSVTSPQIVLNSNVNVTATLTMTDGNLNLNSNSFTVGTSPASTGTLIHAGASTNGWMYNGSITRFMAASNATNIGSADQNEGFFPLGGTADFRPFYVGKNNNAGTGGSVTVTHNNSPTTSTVTFAEGITRRHDANWAVTTSGITGGTWSLRAGGTSFGTIQELPDLRMSTSSGVVGAHAAATGSVVGPRVNRTGLTFGQLTNSFHVASTDIINSPLPVVLVYFKGIVFDAGITLSWETASELENDYFVIERSGNGESYTDLLKVKGMGTTNQSSTYSIIDYNPIVGKSYYRLKQVDFDGSINYLNVISVEYHEPEVPILRLYPNPFNGQTITLELLNTKASEMVPIIVLNEAGVIVNQFTLTPKDSGRVVRTTLEFMKRLNPGVYILKVGGNSFMTAKLVVE